LRCLRQPPGIKTIPLVLILATPSLTSLLDNKALFLPKVLRDVFGKPSERLEVDVVFAVVDRISHRHIDGTKRHTMYGSEGLSIFVTRSKDAAPDLWNTGQQSLGNTSPPSENLATLSIEICYKRGEDKIHNTFNLPVVHIADVPLANTLFLITLFEVRKYPALTSLLGSIRSTRDHESSYRKAASSTTYSPQSRS
jgi:hypothetical protein